VMQDGPRDGLSRATNQPLETAFEQRRRWGRHFSSYRYSFGWQLGVLTKCCKVLLRKPSPTAGDKHIFCLMLATVRVGERL
jgi:hypothetical protein